MVKINYKSDFKINERSETVALEVPFVFSYYVFDNKKYVASFDGNTYVNCERKEDGSLDVIFNQPGFGIGHLKVERKYAVDDKAFADGVFDVVTVDKTDVFITSGQTFETYVKTLVVPPYIKGDKGDKGDKGNKGDKGDKGDPMTWDGMTKEEQAELVQKVTASTQEADLLEKVTGNEKISVSDGSGSPKAITTEQIKAYIEESKESSSLEFVDLGLPSGTLWATRNIGAEKPEDPGLFFAWGETEGYNVSYTEEGGQIVSTTIKDAEGNLTERKFTFADYKWSNGTWNSLTKYNTNSSYGVVDNLSRLLTDDDAAYAVNNTYRIPSVADFEELIQYTTFSKVSIGSKKCGMFTAANGNYVIFPITGTVFDQISSVNSAVYYPTCEIYPSNPSTCKAMLISDYSELPLTDFNSRCTGLPVRAVKSKETGGGTYDDTEIKAQIKENADNIAVNKADADAKLSELGIKVGSSSIFNSDSRFEKVSQWIGEDGNGVQIAQYARSYFFNVQGLKKLHLSLSPLGGSQDFYHYVFFNSENPNSESIMTDYGVKEVGPASEYVGDVDVPEGAVLLGVSVRTDLGYDNDVSIINYGYILEQSVKTAEDVQQLEDNLSFLGYNKRIEWKNEWIGSDGGGVQIQQTARAYFYRVTGGDIIKLSLSGIHGKMESAYYHYAFYNSDQPSASSLMADYSYIRERGKELNTIVEVPEGAVLIGISVSTNLPNNISFGALGDKLESLTELQIMMENVSNILTKPLDMDLSVFGVLTNGQGILEEEAKGAFLGCYCPVDIKTNYIRIGSEKFISFKKISDNSDYGRTPSIDYTRDEAVVYPIFKDYFDTIKKEVVGFVIINASKIVRESYGTKYVYLVGNKGEYCQFHSSYNSVTEIVLLGDSLTALGSGYANFFDVNGCGRTPFGVGGEKPTQIMGRIGVAPFRLKEDVVIPSEPAAVSIKLVSSFDDKETYPRSNYGLHECVIGGVKGSINVTTAGSAVTFTRSVSGEEVILKEGTDVESCYYGKTNTFNVYWMGQNGYDSDDELVDAFKLCVSNQINNYYLVLTPHLNTSDELEQKMQRTFGNRYINMRRWCALFGLSESGITPTEADMEAISNNQCPPSLLSDGVHFVESARRAIARMIGDKVMSIIRR